MMMSVLSTQGHRISLQNTMVAIFTHHPIGDDDIRIDLGQNEVTFEMGLGQAITA